MALSIAVSISERAFREGSTNAAEKFDLIIGASGSEIQLVLSTVFLQPTKLNLIDYAILNEIKQNPNTAWAAPLTFDMPIIGTDNTFIEKFILSYRNNNYSIKILKRLSARIAV